MTNAFNGSLAAVLALTLTAAAGLMISEAALAGPSHPHDSDHGRQADAGNDGRSGPVRLTGEVADLMCYIDHGALGEGHQECARKCITGGGPVGLVVTTDQGDQQAYLVIGAHQPVNAKLAPLAAKTVTLEGKLVERGGIRMLENVRIVEVHDSGEADRG